MNADLAALIRLQEMRDEIEVLTARIEEEIPARVAELETQLRLVQERFEASRNIIETARKERTRLEHELKAAEDKIGKYKVALMQVKNNDEYRAALNEIDYTQRTYMEIETRVLELMEAAETGQQELGTLEEEMKSEDEKIKADRQLIEQECNQLVAKRGGLEDAAASTEEKLPALLLMSYQRIAAVRRGQGMARVADSGVCGACNMRLRPSVFQQVKRNEEVIACDSCRRILYFVDAEPPAAASPAVHGAATGSTSGRGE